ncbi:MAG TPA: RDD family protein [Acidimicrobiales bacterium]|nr:RDD family protein [Acidimicrobiales bacterium]
MSLEDRYVTPTPEGVSLDVVLAGIGSRFMAFVIDSILLAIVLVVVNVALFAGFSSNTRSDKILTAGLSLLTFLLIFAGYFIVCEMLWSGRSIGKRAAGIRVVSATGVAEGFWSILLRNIARLIDFLPIFYIVGSISILASANNQRIGDMLANTIVIRERHAANRVQAASATAAERSWTTPVYGSATTWTGPALPDALATWDVSMVSDAEIALIRQFLSRRWEYNRESRERLAAQLKQRIESRVAGANVDMAPEEFLFSVSKVKAAHKWAQN